MRRTYNAGSKAKAIRRMAEHAIRDQEALIDAYTPTTKFDSADSQAVIDICKKNIADYKRIRDGVKP